MTYSKIIGLKKTVKNGAAMFVLPAILYLINGAMDWLPQETYIKIAPILALISYFIKNYTENKD